MQPKAKSKKIKKWKKIKIEMQNKQASKQPNTHGPHIIILDIASHMYDMIVETIVYVCIPYIHTEKNMAKFLIYYPRLTLR